MLGRIANTYVLTDSPASTLSLGVGRGFSARAPQLAAYSTAWLGNASFALDLGKLTPLAPVALLLAIGPAALDLGGGCIVRVNPTAILASLALTANGQGFATHALPVPTLHTLRGLAMHAQAATLDLAAPFDIGLSRGLEVRLGD